MKNVFDLLIHGDQIRFDISNLGHLPLKELLRPEFTIAAYPGIQKIQQQARAEYSQVPTANRAQWMQAQSPLIRVLVGDMDVRLMPIEGEGLVTEQLEFYYDNVLLPQINTILESDDLRPLDPTNKYTEFFSLYKLCGLNKTLAADFKDFFSVAGVPEGFPVFSLQTEPLMPVYLQCQILPQNYMDQEHIQQQYKVALEADFLRLPEIYRKPWIVEFMANDKMLKGDKKTFLESIPIAKSIVDALPPSSSPTTPSPSDDAQGEGSLRDKLLGQRVSSPLTSSDGPMTGRVNKKGMSLDELGQKLTQNSVFKAQRIKVTKNEKGLMLANATGDNIASIKETKDHFTIRAETNTPQDNEILIIAQAILETDDPTPSINAGRTQDVLALASLLVDGGRKPVLSDRMTRKLQLANKLDDFNRIVVGETPSDQVEVEISKPKPPTRRD